MATKPSSPPRTAPSAANSGNSAAQSPSFAATSNNQVEGTANNGVFHVDQKMSDFAQDLDDLDSVQCIGRFKKYDAEYSCRLMTKYFSGNSFYGGNIFDEQMTVADETIKSSRWPCYRSYADPISSFQEQSSNGSTPAAETPENITNGKLPMKKS